MEFHFFNRITTILLATLTTLIVFTCHCGSNPNSSTAEKERLQAFSGNTGSARLVVRNSLSADFRASYGSIKTYRATVTGENIDPPIEAEFDGDATNGVMEGIPVGPDRIVTIEATNLNDQLIRKGVKEDVVVAGGEVSEVEVELNAVPIFTNIIDGNVIPSTRLRFELFADPEDPLEIEDKIGDAGSLLFDLGTGGEEVYPDLSTGLAVMRPGPVEAGEHVFTVRSRRTGESTSVTVKVIDGTRIRPAPLYNVGLVVASGDYVGVVRMGSVVHGAVNSGALWPRVLEAVLNE